MVVFVSSPGNAGASEDDLASEVAVMTAGLNAALEKQLPAYMIPSAYIPIAGIPITATGKTDRRCLRDIGASMTIEQLASIDHFQPREHVEPDTASERKLQQLWASVLGIVPDSISANNSFLRIGGDSIAAIRLVAASQAEGLDLNFETILKAPVLRDMAEMMQEDMSQEQDQEISVFPFSLLGNISDITSVFQCATEQCNISNDHIEDIYPSSPTQMGLVASSMRDPGAYLLQLVYQLPSSVDLDRLREAWISVTARIAVMRTRFFEHGAELLQVIVKESVHWQVVDGDLQVLLATEKKRKVELGGRMSWHTVLHQPDSSESYLVWTIHHSLVDGWSISQIASAVEQEYLGQRAESITKRMFNSFIQHIKQQDTSKAEEFWARNLAGATALGFPRLPNVKYIGHATEVLEHEVSFSMRPEGSVTASSMIQAAWALLVGIYSGNTHIGTGTILNGRTTQLRDIDLICGPTLTIVPFRSSIDPKQTLLQLLLMIQRQYLDILPFQHYGLQNIRRLSADAAAACEFQSLLVIQSTGESVGRQQLLREHSDTLSSIDCMLMMECEIRSGSILFRATFDKAVLHDEAINIVFQQLEHLLHRLTFDPPSTMVSDLQTLSQGEMSQILKWNSRAVVPETVSSCVHELVEQRARQKPNAPAICAWDGSLSHDTLDRYTTRLAVYLQKRYNIGAESLVPICFEKSMWVVVSMLAVLKAGGVCVPLDPLHPTSRLQKILKGLGEKFSNFIITSELHHERAAELKVGGLAVGPQTIDNITATDVAPEKDSSVTPANAAFVLFTSGSTGVPKGIVIEHRAFCSSAMAHGSFIQLNEQSRVPQFAAHTFDISIGDMFATLIHCGCICIPSEYDRMNDLSGAIRSLRANHASLTPAVASSIHPQDVPSLKILISAGEPLTRHVIEKWGAHVNLINMYGPAECSVYCAGKANIDKYDQEGNLEGGVGARLWIVNPADVNHLVPFGGTGELLIEGPILARGYLGNEALTNAAFIEDPTWARHGAFVSPRRFYRSGDLASYSPDGTLTIVGRNDGQVKMRGQRLEVGEFEFQLREMIEFLIDVAVSTVNTSQGENLLAAFLVIKQDRKIQTPAQGGILESPTALEQFRVITNGIETKLSSVLPGYMIPSLYIPLEALPLSSSGKVDRWVLKNLVSTLSPELLSGWMGYQKRKHVPPSTAIEKSLHSLWEILLKSDQIGLEDNFFQLGGDSLLAMNLVAFAREKGMALSVDGIFRHPTLGDMASIVRQSERNVDIAPFSVLNSADITDLRRQAAEKCGLNEEQIEDMYPSTALQRRWIAGRGRSTSEPKAYQWQSVYSILPSIDLDKFRAAWNAMVERHTILRTRLTESSVGILQVVVNEIARWESAISLHDYLTKDRLDGMTYDSRLLRLAIVESEQSQERYFVLSIQHAIYDGFSLSQIYKELEKAYNGEPLGAAQLQMNQYMKFLTDGDKVAAVKFWTSSLADAETGAVLDSLHSDGQTAENLTYKEIAFDMPRINSSDVTISTIIEVTIGLVFARNAGLADIMLRSMRSGRESPLPDIHTLVGPVIRAMPVRIHVDPAQTILDLIYTAQSFQRTIMQHSHMDYEEIVKISGLESILHHSIHVNVIPGGFDGLDLGLGLKLVDSFMRNMGKPGLQVVVDKEKLGVSFSSDDAFVPVDWVMKQLNDIKEVLLKVLTVYQGRLKLSVEEVLYD